MSGGEVDEDPTVELARQHAEYRKTQLRLKQQMKKGAKLKEEQQRLREEALAREEESKAALETAESKAKEVRRLKKKFDAKLAAAKKELSELQARGACLQCLCVWSGLRASRHQRIAVPADSFGVVVVNAVCCAVRV
jgi:hypothetical protein